VVDGILTLRYWVLRRWNPECWFFRPFFDTAEDLGLSQAVACAQTPVVDFLRSIWKLFEKS